MRTIEKRKSITALDFMTVIFKYWMLVASIVTISTVVTVLVMIRTPDVYEAQVGILLNTTTNIRLTDKDRAESSVSLREVMNSETEWLLSTSVLEKTYELTYPDLYKSMNQQQIRLIVNSLKEEINGLPKRNASVIQLKCRSKDPNQACDLLNNIVEAQYLLKIGQRSLTEELLKEKLISTQISLDSVNNVLNYVKLETKVYDSDRQITVLVDANDKLYTREQDLKQKVQDQELLVARYHELLLQRRDINLVVIPEGNTMLQAIQERNAQLLNRLREIKTSYSDVHPEMISLQCTLAEMKTDFYEQLASALVMLEQRLASLRNEVQNIQNKIGQNDKDLTRFPSAEASIASLIQHRDRLNELLRVLYRQQSEFDLSVKGDRGKATLELISPAIVPEQPVAPRRTLQTMIVFFMSLVASISLAYVIEMSSGTLETIPAVEEALGSQVVCVIKQKRK